jgi:uncharacterized protein with PIN domain
MSESIQDVFISLLNDWGQLKRQRRPKGMYVYPDDISHEMSEYRRRFGAALEAESESDDQRDCPDCHVNGKPLFGEYIVERIPSTELVKASIRVQKANFCGQCGRRMRHNG